MRHPSTTPTPDCVLNVTASCVSLASWLGSQDRRGSSRMGFLRWTVSFSTASLLAILTAVFGVCSYQSGVLLFLSSQFQGIYHHFESKGVKGLKQESDGGAWEFTITLIKARGKWGSTIRNEETAMKVLSSGSNLLPSLLQPPKAQSINNCHPSLGKLESGEGAERKCGDE